MYSEGFLLKLLDIESYLVSEQKKTACYGLQAPLIADFPLEMARKREIFLKSAETHGQKVLNYLPLDDASTQARRFMMIDSAVYRWGLNAFEKATEGKDE